MELEVAVVKAMERLLKLGPIAAGTAPPSPTHYSTTPLLHHFTISLLHYCTTPPFHYSTTSLFHYFTTPLLHYSTISLLHYSTTPPFHYSTTALLHHFTTPLLHYFTISLLHYCTTSGGGEALAESALYFLQSMALRGSHLRAPVEAAMEAFLKEQPGFRTRFFRHSVVEVAFKELRLTEEASVLMASILLAALVRNWCFLPSPPYLYLLSLPLLTCTLTRACYLVRLLHLLYCVCSAPHNKVVP